MASFSEGLDDEKRFSIATSEGDVTLAPDSPLLASKEYPSSIFSGKSESPPSSIAYTNQSHWPLIHLESGSRTPGRNIRRLYSVVRRRIERAIARLSAVDFEGGKEVHGTVKEVDRFLSSLAEQENEIEFHDALLACAGSKRQDVQIASFRRIITHVTRTPSGALGLRSRCEVLRKSVDRMIRSWKKTGVVYDVEWLHYYDIATLCLTDGPVMHAISQRPEYPNWTNFISVLDCCRNVAETMLAIEFIADQVYSFQYVDMWRYYKGYPIEENMSGDDFSRVLKLASSIRTHFELATVDCPSFYSEDVRFDQLVGWFIDEACFMLHSADFVEENQEHSENSRATAAAFEFFMIYSAVISNIGRRLTPQSHSLYSSTTWMQAFPMNFSQMSTRDTIYRVLKEVEDTHGEMVRELFPPEFSKEI